MITSNQINTQLPSIIAEKVGLDYSTDPPELKEDPRSKVAYIYLVFSDLYYPHQKATERKIPLCKAYLQNTYRPGDEDVWTGPAMWIAKDRFGMQLTYPAFYNLDGRNSLCEFIRNEIGNLMAERG
jgi:hypothetical protein